MISVIIALFMSVNLVSLKHIHDDIIKWKHFPCYWLFVRGIHQWLVDSPDKGQWQRIFMFSLIYAWTNGWANNRDAGDLRCHHAHYDVTVMFQYSISDTCKTVMTIAYLNFELSQIPHKPYIYVRARSQPMGKDMTYLRSSLIGWELPQPQMDIRFSIAV